MAKKGKSSKALNVFDDVDKKTGEAEADHESTLEFLVDGANRASFLKVVSSANRAVPAKSGRKIASCVLIRGDVHDQAVTVIALGSYETIVAKVSATVVRRGAFVVNAKDLNSVVGSLPVGDVLVSGEFSPGTIGTENYVGKANVRCGKASFNLPTTDAKEFPDVPTFHADVEVEYDVDKFLSLVGASSIAMGDDDRFQLRGIYLEAKPGDNLRAVATDGHRLSVAENVAFADGVCLQRGYTVPREILAEVLRTLDPKNDPKIKLGFSERDVHFSYGNFEVFGPMVEGEFPDYDQVLPKSSKVLFRVHRKSIVDALNRVSLLSRNSSWKVSLVVKKEGRDESVSTMTIKSAEAGRGVGCEDIDVRGLTDEIDIYFNAKLLLDALSTITTDEVSLGMNGPLEPVVITPYVEDESLILEATGTKKNLHVVMPMRA